MSDFDRILKEMKQLDEIKLDPKLNKKIERGQNLIIDALLAASEEGYISRGDLAKFNDRLNKIISDVHAIVNRIKKDTGARVKRVK